MTQRRARTEEPPRLVALVAGLLAAGVLPALPGAGQAMAATAATPVPLEAGPGRVPRTDQAATVSPPARTRVTDLLTRIEAHAAANRAVELVRIVREQLPAGDDEAREVVLRAAALGLARVDETADGRAVLSSLSGYEARTVDFIREGGHRTAVPRHDVAGAARYALLQWVRAAQRDHTLRAIAAPDAGTPALIAHPHADTASVRRALLAGVADAIELAPDEQIDLLRARLLPELYAGDGDVVASRAALAAALRLRDRALFDAVIARGDSLSALRAVRLVGETFPAGEAVQILHAATDRAGAASAALYALAALRTQAPAAADRLFDALERPATARAALAAIALQRDPALARRLADWTLRQADPLAQRRGVTALRLDGSEAARAQIRRLLAEPGASDALRDALADAGPGA